MKNNDNHSLKMKQHLILLRRPLPPKFPKLPLHTRKIHTATTEETTSVKSKKSIFLDVASKDQYQRPISIQNICFDSQVQGSVSSTSPFPRAASNIPWSISHFAAGSLFFPSCPSASLRLFRKEKWKRKKKSKKKQRKKEKMSGDMQMSNMLVVSTTRFRPSIPSHSHTTSKFTIGIPEYHHLQEIPNYTQELPPILKDLSVTSLSPGSNRLPTVPEVQRTRRFPLKSSAVSKVTLKVAKLPPASSLPTPLLPRKPQRQAAIESMIEIRKAEISPVQPEGVLRPRRLLDPDAHVLRGERFNTVAATRQETIVAMSNLAIINCQVHGRNALNLMIFCLTNLQILKLRNNPITEIPTEIQQLKYLRSFTIAFNKIRNLPLGLFYLPHLEELDISYNEITEIPNEIQKLRSLDKLIVDGNYLTSFPPGILELNLTKIQYENTFTSHHFWAENSLNSPQCLIHITALFIAQNNLFQLYPKIQRLLTSTCRCDWCHGPRFGKGLHIIRSCDIFGATQLPIMFVVCSPACHMDIRESGFVLAGLPSQRIPLNMDWGEPVGYSAVEEVHSLVEFQGPAGKEEDGAADLYFMLHHEWQVLPAQGASAP